MEMESEEVDDGDAQDTSPQGRVRPDEGSIGQREDRDDHEEDKDTNQPRVDVAVPVHSFIPGEGCVGEAVQKVAFYRIASPEARSHQKGSKEITPTLHTPSKPIRSTRLQMDDNTTRNA